MHKDEKSIALGKHVTIEYYDCDPAILADGKRMQKAFVKAAKASGATVLDSNFHAFEPQGVSGFVIIAESHFSVHAWPEHDYAAVDIFTCGDSIDFDLAVKTLQKELKSECFVISGVMNRGIVGNNGIERIVPIFEDSAQRYTLSWRKRYNETSSIGMSNTVDIYQADDSEISSPVEIYGKILEIAAYFKLNTAGECQMMEKEKDYGRMIEIAQLFDNGSLSAQFIPETGRVYLHFYRGGFFEPREFAELALKLFGGKYYRMQPSLRR